MIRAIVQRSVVREDNHVGNAKIRKSSQISTKRTVKKRYEGTKADMCRLNTKFVLEAVRRTGN